MDFREDTSVDVNATFLFQTEDAIKVEDAEGRQVWLPKSAIRNVDDFDGYDQGDEISLEVGERLATEKGLV